MLIPRATEGTPQEAYIEERKTASREKIVVIMQSRMTRVAHLRFNLVQLQE
jgi:hypothetical protein